MYRRAKCAGTGAAANVRSANAPVAILSPNGANMDITITVMIACAVALIRDYGLTVHAQKGRA